MSIIGKALRALGITASAPEPETTEATGLQWIRGSLPDCELTSREGRMLEMRKHTNGTYRLLVWKLDDEGRPQSSAIAGVYATADVAKYAASVMPLDDEALAKLRRHPFGFSGRN